MSWAKGGNTLASAAYTLDAVGNRTQRLDQAGTHTYGYDNLYRVNSVTYPGQPADTYTYDAFGNRLTKNTTTYTYDAADQMTSAAGVPYGYDNNGNLTSRGTDTFGWDAEDRLTAFTSQTQGSATGVAAGAAHSLALKNDTTVWAWGYNSNGQLGDGTTTERHAPVQVSSLAGATKVAAGDNLSLVIKSDGTVWAWGSNFAGGLGDGTTFDRHAPVQVSALTNVVSIEAGQGHSLAAKTDGTAWAWGWNGNGQLGDNSTTDRHSPVQVSGLTGVTAVAAGSTHSLALKSNGTVWAWGSGGVGELGNGHTQDKKTPVQVSNITNVTAIAAGVGSSFALKSDGTVWDWGNGASTPVQVSLTGITAISAGGAPLALKNDGTVWTWTGSNGTPTQVAAGLSSVSQLASASNGGHYLALKTDATIWGWGSNGNGQLGDGTTTTPSAPVQTLSLGPTASFTYNGDGLRNTRAAAGGVATFTWDVDSSIPQVLDDGTFKYIYGLGRIAEVGPGTTTNYYLPDGLGSTMALTDATGAVVNTYNYDVFGGIRSSSGTQANEFKFTGEQTDASTGLEYLRARYYDPAVGRFLSRDHLSGHERSPSSQHRYAYIHNDPVNARDPTGYDPACETFPPRMDQSSVRVWRLL